MEKEMYKTHDMPGGNEFNANPREEDRRHSRIETYHKAYPSHDKHKAYLRDNMMTKITFKEFFMKNTTDIRIIQNIDNRANYKYSSCAPVIPRTINTLVPEVSNHGEGITRHHVSPHFRSACRPASQL